MTETPEHIPVPVAFEMRALAGDAIPIPVQKILASPAPVKMMAAKGIAAVRPPELALAIYQLAFDTDDTTRAAAYAAPGGLPDKVLGPALADAMLPAPVIHFFAERISPARIEVVEAVLYNRNTADETFVVLAGRLQERELEVILQNEARLLRCPAIVQALYFNAQVRMSSLNRAIELCARNHVRVDGIPSFDEVAQSIAEDASAKDPEVVDQTFAKVLAATATADPATDTDDTNSDRKSPIIDFSKLKLYEKVRLATLGNAYCRQNLLRDPNRMVAMAAIRSPLIQENEVIRASANRSVSEDVIRYIANQREFVKIYAIKLSLVQNPKCPLAFSLRFLPLLHTEDIRKLARSKNVPSALAMAARKLAQTRGLGG